MNPGTFPGRQPASEPARGPGSPLPSHSERSVSAGSTQKICTLKVGFGASRDGTLVSFCSHEEWPLHHAALCALVFLLPGPFARSADRSAYQYGYPISAAAVVVADAAAAAAAAADDDDDGNCNMALMILPTAGMMYPITSSLNVLYAWQHTTDMRRDESATMALRITGVDFICILVRCLQPWGGIAHHGSAELLCPIWDKGPGNGRRVLPVFHIHVPGVQLLVNIQRALARALGQGEGTQRRAARFLPALQVSSLSGQRDIIPSD